MKTHSCNKEEKKDHVAPRRAMKMWIGEGHLTMTTLFHRQKQKDLTGIRLNQMIFQHSSNVDAFWTRSNPSNSS